MENKFNPDDWIYTSPCKDNPLPGYTNKNTYAWITKELFNNRCMPAMEDIVLVEEQQSVRMQIDDQHKAQVRTKRYCWLKMPEGEFSQSWDEEFHQKWWNENAQPKEGDNWKLIEYTCLNDEAFEFTDKMKLR